MTCSSKSDEPEPQPKDFTIFSDIVGTKWVSEYGGLTEFISDTKVYWELEPVYVEEGVGFGPGGNKTIEYEYKYPTVKVYFSENDPAEVYTIKDNQLIYELNPIDKRYLWVFELTVEEYLALSELEEGDEDYEFAKDYFSNAREQYKTKQIRNLVR